ncbi:MAG: hypothetical protein H3C50_04865 [Kiritimatiellae bacterium]|nr:hypothetical protein [Kiritimatiellia bacterium]
MSENQTPQNPDEEEYEEVVEEVEEVEAEPEKPAKSNWLTAMWSSEKKGRKVPWSAVLMSVLIHVLLLAGAGFLTVLVVAGKQKVMFEAKQPPGLPARKLEHSIRVKQMQEQMRKPQIMQRLVADAPSAVSLPEMPQMQMPDQKNLRDSPVMTSMAGGSIGQLGGQGGGAGRGLTGGTGYSDAKFFGENVRTRAICILMDNSQSMIEKGVVRDVLAESTTLLDGLSPVTKFNMIIFVDGEAAMFPQMVFATQENKSNALARLKVRTGKMKKGDDSRAWGPDGFSPNFGGNLGGYSGSTPWKAIEKAVELGADTIFILSDDPPYLKQGDMKTGVEIATHQRDIEKFVRNIETQTGRPVRINPIIYKPRSGEMGQQSLLFYKKIAQITGGRVRVIK